MWRGHLLHLEVYSPDRRTDSRAYYHRSRSVDEQTHVASERELIERIKGVLNGSPVRLHHRVKGRSVHPDRLREESVKRRRLDSTEAVGSRLLQSVRNCSPLMEFTARKDKVVTYTPLRLVSKAKKRRFIRFPLL